MDVHAHHGIDDLLLGLERDRVAAAVGHADKTGVDFHEYGERSEIWTYRMLRLELSFDSEHDYRLSHSTSYHPDTIVRGFNPMGLEEKFLLQKFPHLELDIEITEDEKYFSDQVLHITYGIARGRVVSVTIFPETNPLTEAITWPLAAADEQT